MVPPSMWRMTTRGDEDDRSLATKPAPWATRVWATWVDIMAFLLALVPFVGFAQLTAQPARYGSGEELTPAGIVAAWVGILLYVALWSWNRYVRAARTGQTIGKRRQQLRVVDRHGGTPTTARLVVRDLAHVLDILPFFLGLVWPVWDRRGQTFADKLVGTVVVAAPRREAEASRGETGASGAEVPAAVTDEPMIPAAEPAAPPAMPVSPVRHPTPATRPAGERAVIAAFFRSVDRDDVVALPPSRERFDQDEGHDEALEVARQRGIARPHWIFWHQQAAWVFDGAGNLTAPLNVNWGGDHERVAAVLSTIPAPFRVVDLGPGGVFEIHSDALAQRRLEPFPEVSDTAAVKPRLKQITAQRRKDTEWSDEEVAWMNEVLTHGEVAAQGYVVRWLAGSARLTDGAFEVLVDRWRRIYAAAPRDVLVTGLLRSLEERGDPRLDEVIEVCLGRSRYTFAYGVAMFLAGRGDPADLPRLYGLALTPGKYAHSPGNSVALDGWVRIRAAYEGRPVRDVAAEALGDPGFDEAARRRLSRLAEGS